MTRRKPTCCQCFWPWAVLDVATYADRGIDILGEQDALGFDHKEVGELFNIISETLERSLLDGEVLTRSELGSEALANSKLSSKLGGSCGTKCHPDGLEEISEDVQVSSGEDEDDGGSK